MDNESWTFDTTEFDDDECVCYYVDKEGNFRECCPIDFFENLKKLLEEFSNSKLPFCFTYEYMLECYCAIIQEFNFDRCRVTIEDESEYFTIKLRFRSDCEISLVFPDVSVVADSLDAKFIQFMNGRKEADFKPSVQEIIKKARTFRNNEIA